MANAASALRGAGPGGMRVRSAATPPREKAPRHSRTVSSRTPNASAIRPLVQPASVSRIARARSASPRSCDRARSAKTRFCSSSATTGDLPAMIPTPSQIGAGSHPPHPLASPGKPA